MYSVGDNMPGYLPDTDEPCMHETFDDAKICLIETLKLNEYRADTEDEAEQFSFAAEHANHWTNPSLTLINGRVYWIQDV